jgi:translation initiation factor 3 subunit B
MENGYHIYDFRGELLREEPIEKFKQWSWRPRPATLLTKEEQKSIRKNLREYSRVFEELDAQRITGANQEVIERRRQMLDEWLDFRDSIEREVIEEREELGLPLDPAEELIKRKMAEESVDGEQEQVIEEIVEEVLEESEEVVST